MAITPNSETDLRWMERALELARRGMGLCSPNPMVGCVVLDRDGNLAGEGWHEYERRDHAEVVALREAGERARGGTAYVTLEPCNHTGRTGPCSLALVAAGVARVVAATADPNPLVAGQGLETLRRAGVAVEVGLLEDEARRLNEGFARWIVAQRPFVMMKVAMTLDGKIDGRIAPLPGVQGERRPYWITGPEALAAVQPMRWAADAVLTGVDTVIADDPLLTDRSGGARRRALLRVVLDSALRMPLDSKLVTTAKDDVLVFTVSPDEERAKKLRERGVRVEVLGAAITEQHTSGAEAPFSSTGSLPGMNPRSTLRPDTIAPGRVPLGLVLERLGAEGILTLLTETGSRLNTALLAGGFVDRLRVFCSPQILGSDAAPAFRGMGLPVRLDGAELERFGDDYSVEGLLRDPWNRI